MVCQGQLVPAFLALDPSSCSMVLCWELEIYYSGSTYTTEISKHYKFGLLFPERWLLNIYQHIIAYEWFEQSQLLLDSIIYSSSKNIKIRINY